MAEVLCASTLGPGELDFSVVIPTHNRLQQLIDCLEALARLAYPAARYEVVVVDDGSDASMQPAIVPFLGRMNVTLLRQPNAGPATARNAGAAAARGYWVAFTDDDCRPDPGWLDALAKSLTANPDCAAGGRTMNGLAENPLSTASQVLLEYVYLHFNPNDDDAAFLASNNFALPRHRLIEMNGFDTTFPLAAAEDRELCDRWRWLQRRIVYVPEAVVHHFHWLTPTTFLAQHFNYGRGASIFHRKRRHRPPTATSERRSFYLPLLTYPFTREHGAGAAALILLIGLSQIVMLLGFLWQGCVAWTRAATNRVAGLAYRLRVRIFDSLSHPLLLPCRAAVAFALSILLQRLRGRSSLSLLCRSHRILMLTGPSGAFCLRLNAIVERALRRACAEGGLVESAAADRAELSELDLRDSRIAGMVLKTPRCEGDHVVEKGVLLLKNTERFDSFRRCAALGSLLERYALVLEPSWSAYADPRLLSFCTFRRHRIVVMSPCRADHEFLERLQSNLRPVPTGASDWVDPRVFRPLEGQEKRFDAVMIARWTLMKRHHLLFRALRHIGDPSYRVALVASNVPGDTDRDAIRSMLDQYGLARQIEVFEDLDPAEVNRILNQSKVNLLLSRQEGSNRSLFEGFFAGVPGLAFSNHAGIPKTHFTPATGRLIAEPELARALLYFRDHWSAFDPRPWALANIAPEVTASKLNLVLRRLAQERREPWTQDIVAKCNRPDLHYYPDESAGRGFPTMAELLARFPRDPRRPHERVVSPDRAEGTGRSSRPEGGHTWYDVPDARDR